MVVMVVISFSLVILVWRRSHAKYLLGNASIAVRVIFKNTALAAWILWISFRR